MKKIAALSLAVLMILGVVACGKAGSYADDAYKAVKSHVDDAAERKIKVKSKGHGFHKCRQCGGAGVYYNGEDCPNCNNGYVYE